jgi:hypothetical protein
MRKTRVGVGTPDHPKIGKSRGEKILKNRQRRRGISREA